ncbi:MAG: Uma2 family endonuclease [Sporichthyaceae bacterium]
MRTVVVGEPPVELQALIEKRRALGQDTFDEVWEGEYHVVPAPDGGHSHLDQSLAEVFGPLARAAGLHSSGPFNVGRVGNFRVPDRGVHRVKSTEVWFATAAIVVEILSPGDQTLAKFDFYAAHDVDEICVADSRERTLQWFARQGDGYLQTERSNVLGVSVADVAQQIEWPA